MHIIDIHKAVNYQYDKATKTFSMSERGIPFATEYEMFNSETGGKRVFKFTHSTGHEYDPKTRWVYKSDDITLEICNDAEITEILKQNYLKHKFLTEIKE